MKQGSAIDTKRPRDSSRHDRRPADLFVAGVGRVGSELMRLLEQRADRHGLRVRGIARRQRAVLDPSGVDLARWREAVDGGERTLDELVEEAVVGRAGIRVFVDCSASTEPVAHYERLLRAGVAVVTANKIGFSRSHSEYRRLVAATERGARFHHETTVCAALSVLGTVRDLVDSGDEIRAIDGVLSGSLGLVFDRLMAGEPFSRALAEARERGYTEPDPRDDLSGLDVARKLLILARQAGIGLEPEDVDVEPVLASGVWDGRDPETFWARLPELDPEFDSRRREAEKAGTRLVYLARLENGGASVRLEQVSRDHPASALRATENVVAIRSRRYADAPLVVRGPGAGPELTAAGLVADILRARSEASGEGRLSGVPAPPSRST